MFNIFQSDDWTTKESMYLKEIANLKKNNAILQEKLNVSEKYRNEYKQLCDMQKALISENRERLKAFDELKEQYEKELKRLIEK